MVSERSLLDVALGVDTPGFRHQSHTSALDLLERGVDFGLLDFRRVGVETAELLGFLPCENAVGARLVGFGAHVVLLYGRGVGVVGAGTGWAGVDDLEARCGVSSVVLAVSFDT